MTTFTITHPSGEVSTRTSELAYTHAVVVAAKRAPLLAEAREHAVRMAHAVKVGAIEPREAKAHAKKLERLESSTHGATFSVRSWHMTEEAARSAARLGEKVVEIVPARY